MKYSHRFHAGNFADVHKHVAWLDLIHRLQQKPKGLRLIDTHSGAGLYDLQDAEALKGEEAERGYVRLRHASVEHAALRQFLDTQTRIAKDMDAQSATASKFHRCKSPYAGSALLAAAMLREQDQLCCIEQQATETRALQRAVETATPNARRCQVRSGDGYAQLKALLPPPTRRALALIDPPYEEADEDRHIETALSEALLRFETGVIMLWYPIKRQADADRFVARVLRSSQRPHARLEFHLYATDQAARLNGSGLLVINPPFEFEQDAIQWQAELAQHLGAEVRHL